jgi:hypothetical protein
MVLLQQIKQTALQHEIIINLQFTHIAKGTIHSNTHSSFLIRKHNTVVVTYGNMFHIVSVG